MSDHEPPCACGATYGGGIPDPVLLATWRAAHVEHGDPL